MFELAATIMVTWSAIGIVTAGIWSIIITRAKRTIGE